MNPERWERMQAIFDAAVGLDESERTVLLAGVCHDDEEMLDDVRRMVEAHERGDSLLHSGLPALASRLIDGGLASLAGREIGAYRLVKLIGEGGMGIVYRAERTDTGKQVAMKFLLGANMSAARRALFALETNMHAKLSHPCIAAQYDAGHLPNGTPWFAMEYVQGERFLEYFETHPCPLPDRLRIFQQVCGALEYLHGKGIIHSDLKPSNILIDESGTPKVLDFGIAKEFRRETQLLPELRIMTRGYAAPEWQERGLVDRSTDVYSMGVILSQLVTGDVGKTRRRELDKICGKARRSDPAKRYRSVEALARDIEHFVKNEPLEGMPATRWYRLERFATRRRAAVVAGTIAALLFAAMATFFTVRLAREKNAALAEVQRTKLVERFLFNLFQGGDKEAGPATEVRALTLIGRGEQEAKALDHDPQLQAEFYGVLGRIYQQLGQFDKADALLTNAVNENYSAVSLLALGSLRLEQGRFDDAVRIARKTLDQPELGELERAKAQSLLGGVLNAQGKYTDAIVLLKQAWQIQSAHPAAREDLAGTFVALSDACFFQSRHAEAESWMQQAMKVHQQLHGRNHPLVAMDWRALGHIQVQTTHFLEAEKCYRAALAIEEGWYGEDHPETADVQIYVAQVLEKEGRLAEAEPIIRKATEEIKRAYPEYHPRVALALCEMGNFLFVEDRFAEAEPYYKRSLEIYGRTLGEDHLDTNGIRNNLASVYLKQKKYAEAQKIFEQSIDSLERTNLGNTLNAGIARIKLGRALTRQGKYRQALVQIREGCRIVSAIAGPNAEWLKAIQPDLEMINKSLSTKTGSGETY